MKVAAERAATSEDLITGLEIIKSHAGRPAINDGGLCRGLLLRQDEASRQWAKSNHLPLSRENYFNWLNGCIEQIDTLDPTKETGWIVHSNMVEDFHGALLALGILSGQTEDTLNFLHEECERVEGRIIAWGLCSVLYRHLGNDAKSTLGPTHESLAWAGKRCKPKMFKEAASTLMMDEENYDHLIKPLIASIKAAPAHLEAASLQEKTQQASAGPNAFRL